MVRKRGTVTFDTTLSEVLRISLPVVDRALVGKT